MKKFLKSKILWLVLIVLVAVVFLMQMNAGKGLEVETIQPVKANLTQTIVVSGQLQAIDADTVFIPQGTRVETVSVREGDVVKRGQTLASGDTTDLALQKERLLLTQEQLERDIKEITDPTKTSIQTGIDSRITQARSSVATLETKLTDAKKRLEDVKVLYSSGSIAKSELDAQTNLVSELANQLLSARASLNALFAERSDLDPDTSLRLTALNTQLQQVQVDLNRIEESLSKITYTATLDGVVTRVIPSAGRTAGVDTYIRIDDLSGYLVESFVPQEDALSLEKGQTASVRIKGKNTETYAATVLLVGQYAAIEAASGSQAPRVRVLFSLEPISDKTLPVGYEADVEVVTGTAPETWTVLREAIASKESGSFVWTVVDGKASPKPVSVLLQDDTRAAVEGLDGTETIIALPYTDLSDNTPVVSVKKEAGQ